MKDKNQDNPNAELRPCRVVVNLNREEFEFIDKIGKDALFTTGKRLTNNKIIMAFINIMKEVKIDGKGLSSCEELKERILVKLGARQDRRKYPRFKKEVKLSWRKLDSMAKYEEGKTIELGEGGFRIELDKKRKVGEVVEFTIHDPQDPNNPIKALGKIMWVKNRSDKTESGLEAGIQLTYLPIKDKERFNELFYDKAKEEKRG